LEASALTHASQRGLLARRSPLLKLQGDERLIAMARSGNPGAFETLVDRYQGRLLGFCRQMLGSTEDAEDVLQEVFVNAYRAMLADEREINLRPWLYRIARNRCLNHLRKPTADAQESMDMVPAIEAASTAERVHNREEFRQLLSDVRKLPETQRSALLLREMDALSYEEIAQAMDTSVPSVKSLLVRARISLAEANQARQLTCGEVRLELAEAVEGLRKISGPVRRHVRECEGCADFRSHVRSNEKALAALAAPVGPLLALKGFIASKLGLGGVGAGGGAAGTSAGAAGAVGSVGGAALGGGGAAGGIGAVGGALGAKAVAGVVTAAVLTAGAGEVAQVISPAHHGARVARHAKNFRPSLAQAHVSQAPAAAQASAQATAPPTQPAPTPVSDPAPASSDQSTNGAGQSTATGSDGATTDSGTPAVQAPGAATAADGAGTHSDGGIAVVTIGAADSSGSTTTTSDPPPDSSSTPPASSDPAPPPSDSSSASSSSTDVSPAEPAP
jgi:RNA polymerase sigma factor (sigma-70 family)